MVNVESYIKIQRPWFRNKVLNLNFPVKRSDSIDCVIDIILKLFYLFAFIYRTFFSICLFLYIKLSVTV